MMMRRKYHGHMGMLVPGMIRTPSSHATTLMHGVRIKAEEELQHPTDAET
jgi:hypothetical protein